MAEFDNKQVQNIERIVNRKLNTTLRLKDIPAGSKLERELALSYGEINFSEEQGDQFIWGVSIWGNSRIGGNK
jgi:hypothetical protein